MMATLAWKEYREQRSIWLTIALLAAVLLLGVLELVNPLGTARPMTAKFFTLITICLASSIGYGLAVGAVLIAGERESGTLDFLDMSAGSRLTIWATKTLIGAAGVLILSLALAGILLWLDASQWFSLFPPYAELTLQPGRWDSLAELPLWSLYAFVAGLLASTTSRSVFVAAALGLFYGIGFVLLGLLISLLLAMTITGPGPFNGIFRVAMAIVTLALLYASYRLSCGIDLARVAADSESAAAKASGHARRALGLRRVLWLSWKQGSGLVIGAMIALAALVFALINLFKAPVADRLIGMVSWPLCALFIGVVAGMAAFAGEQARQANRFLGDQRLPIGKIWLLKTLAWLLFAAIVSLLISCGSSFPFFDRYPNDARDMTLWPGRLNAARWLLFLLCVAYGFALGQFLVLLFERPAVAGLLALVASLVSLIWVPSLVAGGTHWYAVLLPPVILVSGTWLLMRPWVAGFPTAQGRTISLATLLLFVASLALGIGQRVWEVPDVPLPFNVERYSRSLSTPLGTEAGVLTHSALHGMQQRIDLARWKFGTVAQKGPYGADHVPWRVDLIDASNMPIHDKELAEVLQFVCAGDWIPKLRRLQALPRGAIMDPREMRTIWTTPEMEQAKVAALILCNHARLSERQGQLSSGLDDYETAFELILTMAHQADESGFLLAEQVSQTVLGRLNHWGTKAAQQPDLLGRAGAAARRFGASLPCLVDVDQASYLAMRSFLSQPELPSHYPPEATIARDNSLSLVPWEAERRLRLLNALFAGRIKAHSLSFAEWVKDYREGESGIRRGERLLLEGWMAPTSNGSPLISTERLARWLEQTWWESYVSPWGMPLRLARLQAFIRAAELRFALIQYAVENRRPASALADLVPKYVRAIPSDPYDGKPFRYRVSVGEKIFTASTGTTRRIQRGQGILWCVGPDLIDDHGAVEDQDDRFLTPKKKTGDILFIVSSVDELLR
jgi:ABC-type transport system involved in multi-copper enzyme maturation permease subunit